MDIFKVPTCCSCHLVGYKEAFPPLASPSNSISSVSLNRQKPQPQPQDYDAFSSSSNRNSQYSTLNGSDDVDDEEDSNIAYQFGNGFKRLKPKKSSESVQPNVEIAKNRHQSTKRVPIFPESYLTPPANNPESNFPFTSRGPSRPRTPTLKRKQFDQNFSESDSKSSRVTVFPPPKLFSQSERPRKITPPIASTIDTNSVNLRLPNAQNSEHKRINYNYHPIIDFFEDDEPKQNGIDRKTGKLVADDNSWRPMVGG